MAENELARVWDIRLEPGEVLTFHMHYHPYLMVALSANNTNAEIESIFGDKRFGHDQPGRLLFFNQPAPIHQLTNASDNINLSRLIELKTMGWNALGEIWQQDPPQPSADDPTGLKLARERGIELGEVGTSLLMENDVLRVWEVMLQPGETIPFHHHKHPYVVVSLEGDENRIETIFGDQFPTHEPRGSVVVIDQRRAVHRLTNVSDVNYRSRLVEFKTVTFASDEEG
jgi:predicted metal-dependent enzyme (double-stranded beta helix superfamily)